MLRIGRINNNSTLMSKLIRYFLVIILMMFVLIAYSIFGFKSFYSNFYTMLEQLVEIHSIHMEMDDLHQQIINYTNSSSKDSLVEYERILSNLNERIDALKSSGSNNDNAYYIIKHIKNMLSTYDSQSKEIINDYDTGKGIVYINHSTGKLTNLKGYIQDEITALLFENLLTVQNYYKDFRDNLSRKENTIYILTVFITMVCILFAISFARQISIPVHQLVLRARKVAEGNLDIDEIKIKTNYELNSLIDSFNYMFVQIKRLINDIENKAQIENKLKEQEIKNLEISNLLNESELKLLQSQINPHFLFNTMNTIIALAQFEKAKQTKKMLESMAEILRYNLKKIDMAVTLGDEYETIKNYVYIQQMRFGEKITYILNIDESALDFKVPSMILQPFIENSTIHGLEPKEGKGMLTLSITDMTDCILITIKDNGVGIPEEKLKLIVDRENNSSDGSSTGIGMKNVMRRLELKYGKNIVEIKSKPGSGTEVRIRLDKSA